MMQRVLSHKTSRQAPALRSLLLAICEPPGPLCCCSLRLPPPATRRQRWVATSASKAAERPKQPQQQQRPPEEEAAAHPGGPPPPHSQAGGRPLHGAAAGAEASSSSSSSSSPAARGEPVELDPLQDTSIGLLERYKRTFKQYGKVMIPVHLLMSSVWFGSFYYAAMKGVNVVPFLELMGLPESIVCLLRDSSSGYALTAYAMYKIATPARYTVTLGGTSLSVQYLRKHGYLSTPPPVKDYIHDRMEETRDMLTEKMEETKERLSEKMEETKELLTEKMEGTKERLSERMEHTKDILSEKLQETKDKVSETTMFRKKNDK